MTMHQETGKTVKVPDVDLRPFEVHIPEEAVADLRQRANATRWPDKETVADRSQGTQLSSLRELVAYWGGEYDWRRFEATLNALPNFMTTIDGLGIHLIHVASKHEGAMPLILTHGWPGSVAEFLKTIGPLTDPTAHGGSSGDAFHVVIPSLPGYGFSERPESVGWDPEHIARAWAELMQRLGYPHYVAQGGDWGAVVTQALGRQALEGLLGIHLNLPAALPIEVASALGTGKPPDGLSDQERAVFDALVAYRKSGSGSYLDMLTARPQAMGYGMTDSPAGLAAWFLVHPGFTNWSFGADAGVSPTKDEVLDDFSLYWLTNSPTSAARLYGRTMGSR